MLPLQACKPSNHVCSTSPPLPQLLNQVPPGAQQLSLPDFLMVAHLEQIMELIVVTVVAVAAYVGMWVLGQRNKESGDQLVSFNNQGNAFCISWSYLCRHASLRSTCAQRLRCRHRHTSCTKRHREHNNWLYQISWRCRTWDTSSAT